MPRGQSQENLKQASVDLARVFQADTYVYVRTECYLGSTLTYEQQFSPVQFRSSDMDSVS